MSSRQPGEHQLSAQQLSADEVRALRLRALRLSSPASTVAEATRSVLALQAQDFGGALWAVGARCVGARVSDVEAALNDGTLVRSWPMRGTHHLTLGEDAGWLNELCRPRPQQAARSHWPALGLDERIVARAADAVRAALADGRALTRSEVYDVWEAAGVATSGGVGQHLLRYLSQDGGIVQGPRREAADTFMAVAARVPAPRRLTGDDALRELAERFLSGRGVAGAADLAWWSGLTVSESRRALTLSAAIAVTAVHPSTGELIPAFASAAALETLDEAVAAVDAVPVLLLPPFDEYQMVRERAWTTGAAAAGLVGPGKNGLVRPIVVRRGEVIGAWSRRERPGRIEISLDLPGGDSRSGDLGPALDRLAAFWGTDVVLASSVRTSPP